VEYRLLGPLEVLDDEHLIEFPAGKPRALLGLLLLDAPRVVSVDRLVDRLWGADPPATAEKIVQGYVSRLRKALPSGGMLETRAPGYCLAVSEAQTDLGRFRRLHREADEAARAGRVQGAVVLLREALALWRGPPLADVAPHLELGGELAAVAELALTAREELIELELALGKDARLIPELEALIAAAPMRERPRAQLMTALYRSGRQAEALEVYREWRKRLAGELGLEPSAELRDLEQRILAHDATISPVPADQAATSVQLGPRQSREEVVEPVRRGERRKVVTVVCCAASHWLHESADPEALASRLERCQERLTAAIERHGGVVATISGEMATAIFGLPSVREDDPVRALRAAQEARKALEVLGVEAQIGVATGAILARGPNRAAIGEPLNTAAQIARGTPRGAIVLGETTRRLAQASIRTEALAPLESKGGRIRIWRLLDIQSRPAARGFDSPFIGRGTALETLTRTWRQVTDSSSCELVTVVGAAGLGKSRLAHELVRRVDATAVYGRCPSYGDGITYLPLLELLEQLEPHVDSMEAVARRPLDVLAGGDGSTSPDELAWAARKLLEASAANGPLVVVFDDIQWAEAAFLDLLEQLALLSTGRAVMVICLARPELLERRPGWPGVLWLDPLDPAEMDQVVESRLARSRRRLPEASRARIVADAGGNPLFGEELTAAKLGADSEVTFPRSIQALLAARLDQLNEAERVLLEAAAVEGEVFHHNVLAALSPDTPQLTMLLAGLVRKDLIRPARSRHAGDDAFRFRHLLLRDAVYESTSKGRRAELHEQLANWLDHHRDRTPEPDEIIGYQLEQANRYVTELFPGSERARGLALTCADRLAAAGRHALTRADILAAINLLERAGQLDDRPERPIQRDLDLADALYSHGRLNDGRTVLELASAHAATREDRATELRVLIALRMHELAAGPEDTVDRLERLCAEALALFERTQDDAGLMQSWLGVAFAANLRAQYGSRNEAFERALVHARRCRDSAKARTIEVLLAIGHLYGPTPVAEAIAWLDAHPQLAHEPSVIGVRSVLEAMRGNPDAARTLYRQASARSEELGAWYERGSLLVEYDVELLAGDAAAAADYARAGCAMLDRMGERSILSTQAGRLGRALCELGAYDEAADWAQRAKHLGAVADTYTQMLWREVEAKVHAQRGDTDTAVRLAREAVAIAAQTDAVDAHGDALMDLAEVLRRCGEAEPALAAAQEAHSLYERKGNTVMAVRSLADVPLVE
jgi:DNA-binding SARP family transcriptional activator/tetratricopeptide (TPR) repeat protein